MNIREEFHRHGLDGSGPASIHQEAALIVTTNPWVDRAATEARDRASAALDPHRPDDSEEGATMAAVSESLLQAALRRISEGGSASVDAPLTPEHIARVAESRKIMAAFNAAHPVDPPEER